MIGRLRGTVEAIENGVILLDVNGVGYEVYASGRTLAALAPGATVTLVIETHVREDHIHLYGFLNGEDRRWFRLLTTVKGVGARMAQAILGGLSPEELHTAIAARDKTPFTRISGVGPKLAERLITELKDKAGTILPDESTVIPLAGKASTSSGVNDAIQALTQLGYGRSEAYSAIHKAAASLQDASVSELVTLGLKELAS
ncbi:MAG: Holliday junction branch migration protein RuvA [Hyphomicrobiales bacterium]|nr:Holliday junction branch migration protein RuvA [Rickettsiales bacterium]MCP5361197.1 Holliday junction branch migration protein RuvA [Hyphomicrobiales bacterium]